MAIGNLDQLFRALSRSRFRSGFRLNTKDAAYLKDKGLDRVLVHATELIRDRLAPAQPPNDGRQTPWKGHPVFVAQHATATCCRSCLAKWHSIPKGQPLSSEQMEYTVQVIRRWLESQATDRNSEAVPSKSNQAFVQRTLFEGDDQPS